MPGNPSCGTTCVPLLQQTQAYLQTLLRRQAPDSVLAEAWQEFYRVYNKLIRRFAVARGMRHADVDDCVQEVCNAVAAKLTDFKRPEDRPGLRAWLYTLVRSKATDLIRRKGRHAARRLGHQSQAAGEPRGKEPDPADLFERQWESAMLQTALDELRTEVSELNHRVPQMRLLEARGVAEVAAELDIPLAQVRYRQHRTLKKLRARMAVYTGEHFGQDG